LLGFIDQFGLGDEIVCHRDQRGGSLSVVNGRGEPKADGVVPAVASSAPVPFPLILRLCVSHHRHQPENDQAERAIWTRNWRINFSPKWSGNLLRNPSIF
jgi:hypothetical protein